jgi:hypothetical protein
MMKTVTIDILNNSRKTFTGSGNAETYSYT